jgi:transposase
MGKGNVEYPPGKTNQQEGKMGRKKTYEVNLSQAERDHLENLTSAGIEKARKLTRARILLKADEGWTDNEIGQALDVGTATMERIRKKYADEGLDGALNRKPTSRQQERKIDGATEAHLITLACSKPPEGFARWTLNLLAERLVRLEQVEIESVSSETVRRALKKTNLSPGRTNNG